MRAAVLLLPLLTACPIVTPRPLSAPELVLVSEGTSGELIAWPAGTEVGLRALPNDCASRENLQLQNVGRSGARFRVNAPSARFDHDTGPFELASGQTMRLSVLIDPRGEFAAGGVLRHAIEVEFLAPENAPTATFPVAVPVLGSDAVPVSFDFGAVPTGARGELPWNSLTQVDAGVFFRGDAGQLVFEPPNAGHFTVNVGWQQRAECTPVAVPLMGDGVDSLVASEPADVDFGDVRLGMGATRELVFQFWTNERDTYLRAVGDGGFLVGERPDSFSSTRRDEQRVLIPAAHRVTVRFVPAFIGRHEGSIALSVGLTGASARVRGNGVP